MEACCLNDPTKPLTHTIGYALKGCLEGYVLTVDKDILEACVMAAQGLLGTMDREGFIPGRLDNQWGPAASWSCMTGTVQIAECWFMLHGITLFQDGAWLPAVRCTGSCHRARG